jgi:hypothetical protein
VIALVGLGANDLLARAAISSFHPTDEDLRRLAPRRRQRNLVLYPVYAAFGIGCGLIAGSIPSYWPDAISGLLVILIGVLLPLAMLPSLKRRTALRRASQADHVP